MGRDFHGHVFHIAVLRPARRAVHGDAALAAAQARGTADHDDLSSLALNPRQPMQRTLVRSSAQA